MIPWKEFYESAEENFQKGRYTAASEDYAKAIFLMIDEYLKKKYGITVTNHQERRLFLLSKAETDENCKKLLEIYERVYEIYRETYTRSLTKEEALILRMLAENVRKIIE